MNNRRSILCATLVIGIGLLPAARRVHGQSSSTLNIRPTNSRQLQLSWPAGTNFDVLQQLPVFGTTNDWQDVPDAPEWCWSFIFSPAHLHGQALEEWNGRRRDW
jgi:hypothetical protein